MRLKVFLLGVLPLLSTLAFSASAPDQDELWRRIDEEQSWRAARLEVPGLTGEITAYITGEGRVKLENIGDQVLADADLASSQFSQYKDQAQYLSECENTVNMFPEYRDLKNPYLLSMKVFTTSVDGLDYVARTEDGATRGVSRLDTRFLQPDYFKVKVDSVPGALMIRAHDMTVARLEAELSAQMQAQLATAVKSGEAHFDLTGLDDVVCDLVAGRLKLKVQVYYHYSRPKLYRQTRLSAPQVADVYDFIKARFQARQSARANLVIGAAQLERALERSVRLNPEITDDEIVRLHGLLFEDERNELRALNPPELSAVAARMDRLRTGDTYTMPVFEARVRSPFATSTSGKAE